jgi:hypothetical protein
MLFSIGTHAGISMKGLRVDVYYDKNGKGSIEVDTRISRARKPKLIARKILDMAKSSKSLERIEDRSGEQADELSFYAYFTGGLNDKTAYSIAEVVAANE